MCGRDNHLLCSLQLRPHQPLSVFPGRLSHVAVQEGEGRIHPCLRQESSMQLPASELPEPCAALKGVRIVQVSCGSRHTLARSAQGAVYSWGWGACGQLGHGDDHCLPWPRFIQAFWAGGNSGVTGKDGTGAVAPIEEYPPGATLHACSISAGGIHSAAIIEGGAVYTWGGSSYGQLGLGTSVMSKRVLAVPGRVMLPPEGALGPEGDHSKEPLAPQGTPISPRVTRARLLTRSSIRPQVEGSPTKPLVASMVSCGGMHTAAVTPQGEVYCWGRADSGQLGIGYEWVHETAAHVMGVEWPSLVTGLLGGKRTVSVSCGGFHTAAVTKDGCMYTWGKEDFGMLGCSNAALLKGGLVYPHAVTIGKVRRRRDKCGKVFLGAEKAVSVACGGWHTAVVADDGRLWACGRGEYGRLGLGDDTCQWQLKPVPLQDGHQLVRYGSGQLGTGSGDGDTLDAVADETVQVCLGGSHTLVLTKAGKVYAYGRQGFGRLGTGGRVRTQDEACLKPVEVTALQRQGWKVESLSCGGVHSAAILVRDNGKGEQG
ncbi:unnamed protein product [Discosporangium mesarthrocarpum]